MQNVVFDNVVVTNPGAHPFGDLFYQPCDGIDGTATGTTTPIPLCFKVATSKA